MEAIKFKIWGMGATFKRPYNNIVNLTYSNIHKIALLGILGAIIGLKGYERKDKSETYPDFYEKLKGLKISIVPYNNGMFFRDKKTFTETTGFFNKDSNQLGATLVTKEQFLINPTWDIYIQQGSVTDEIYEKIKSYLLKRECEYEPYLGRNHYPASIENVEIIEIEEVCEDELYYIDSLFPYDKFELQASLDIENEEFCTEPEYMPIRLTRLLNHYYEERFCLSNYMVSCKEELTGVFRYEDLVLYFF